MKKKFHILLTLENLNQTIAIMKSILLLVSLIICLSAASQTITYKASKWGDTQKTHDWATALDNPVVEPVTILQSPTVFKVTLGKKIKVYKIISNSKMDENTTVFNTLHNSKPYIIKVMYISSDKTYAILCENEWAVTDISNPTTGK
jgi:hypothetical protein